MYYKRKKFKDSNYERYYDAEKNSGKCNCCPAKDGNSKWKGIYSNLLKSPVNTNWKKNDNNISKIIICESPSDSETSYGLPVVGRTGQGIYKGILGNEELKIGWLDELYKECYITNIVRCQADAGVKGCFKNYRTKKNQRVREAWEYCQEHFKLEMGKIFKNISKTNKLEIYISIGNSFPCQKKEVVNILEELKKSENLGSNVVVKSTSHPSSK